MGWDAGSFKFSATSIQPDSGSENLKTKRDKTPDCGLGRMRENAEEVSRTDITAEKTTGEIYVS